MSWDVRSDEWIVAKQDDMRRFKMKLSDMKVRGYSDEGDRTVMWLG